MEPIKLSSMVVYNSTFGPKEGEEEKKILYYYPENESLYKKINNIGLCEALVQFTMTLSPGVPCEYMHTQKHDYIFYEAEEHYWMIMVLSKPVTVTSDGKKATKEDQISTSACRVVLKEVYQRFHLLHGLFSYIVHFSGVSALKDKLLEFFKEFLSSLHLSETSVLHVFRGLMYCNLDNFTLLKFQSCANTIQSKFDTIKHCIITLNGHMVTSSLLEDDSQVIVSLCTEKLSLGKLSASRKPKIRPNKPMYQLHHGKFLSSIFQSGSDRVFITLKSGMIEQMHMLIYQAFGTTSVFFLDHLPTALIDICKELDACVGPLLSSLTSEIQFCPRINAENYESNFRHIFFNQQSLSLESTYDLKHSRNCTSSVPTDVMHVICDINECFSDHACQEKEVIVKVQNESWVAAKKANKKMLFVVINSKNANLIAVNEDVRRMSTHFDSMHFSD
ncbi:unnamed protein product [Clavelina lepadiformis]|uniref:Vacuolar fusion protein CCZ1 homolog n=1 Tax=Clavelina lepadiformis TaxID=159417 RepID=A0ABP0GYI7_CLALP